jgi:hypothetical protein
MIDMFVYQHSISSQYSNIENKKRIARRECEWRSETLAYDINEMPGNK